MIRVYILTESAITRAGLEALLSGYSEIEIAAAEGATVTAVHRGRVAFADWLRGFGLLTIVDHGNGFMSLYAHADVLYKQVGDQVEGGEAIATAGKSGGQTEPGLYFEIRAKGAPVDPVPWLAKR